MKKCTTFHICLSLLLAAVCAAAAPIAGAETLYVETYDDEAGFPTHPEVDKLDLGGMGASSNSDIGAAPPVPVINDDRASATVVSLGTPPGVESASTYVNALPLIADALPFEATGHFDNLTLPAEGSVGLVAMLLYSTTTRYFVSASLYVFSDGISYYPSFNIAEIAPGLPPVVQTGVLPGVPVTSQGFDLTLVVDPASNTVNTRLDIGGLRYELQPLTLAAGAFDTYRPDVLTQTVGIEDRSPAGRTTSVDFRRFSITTPLIHADIDVKPLDSTNVISQRSRTPTSVAIFSRADFDATTVLPATLTLAGAPVAQTRTGTYLCAPADVDRDKRKDLLCGVDTPQIDAPRGESVVQLNAYTSDGAPVRGQDTVRVVR